LRGQQCRGNVPLRGFGCLADADTCVVFASLSIRMSVNCRTNASKGLLSFAKIRTFCNDVPGMSDSDDISAHRHQCVDCGKFSPQTETNYTLISSQHGWRLTLGTDAQAKRVMQWRCPKCWAKRKPNAQ